MAHAAQHTPLCLCTRTQWRVHWGQAASSTSPALWLFDRHVLFPFLLSPFPRQGMWARMWSPSCTSCTRLPTTTWPPRKWASSTSTRCVRGCAGASRGGVLGLLG